MRKFLTLISCFLFLSVISLASTMAIAGDNTPPPSSKEWTLLVYLNGNNNLDSYGKLNIKQMEEVGSTKDINIVVQWASLENAKTQRLYVVRSTDPKNVTSPIVQNMGTVDMGNWKSIVDFVRWGVANYPAKHYFLDVWDHGSGWHALRALNSTTRSVYSPLDISWDDNSGNHITTLQLGQALAQSAQIIGHKIDLYASDACLMAMAEVADQVASSVQIYGGSEEVEPGAGWPYNTLLQRWAAKPLSSAAEVSQILTEEYVKSYNTGGSNENANATFSSFDLSKMKQLNASISKFGQSILKLNPADRAKLLTVANATQSFTYSDYKDLSDFLAGVDAAGLSGLERGSTDDIRRSVNEFIIAHAATTGYEKALGLSIWLPTSSDTYNSNANGYQSLLFQSQTHWGEALRFLVQ